MKLTHTLKLTTNPQTQQIRVGMDSTTAKLLKVRSRPYICRFCGGEVGGLGWVCVVCF